MNYVVLTSIQKPKRVIMVKLYIYIYELTIIYNNILKLLMTLLFKRNQSYLCQDLI